MGLTCQFTPRLHLWDCSMAENWSEGCTPISPLVTEIILDIFVAPGDGSVQVRQAA